MIIIKKAFKNKPLSVFLIFILAVAGYYGYGKILKNSAEARYIFAKVQKGTLISSVSASGQVAALNQVDIKTKVSGNIVYVGEKAGQEVKAGALLAQIDAADAARAVRDAETTLQTAMLELDEILKPASALSLLQAENALTQSKESKQKSEDNFVKAHEDGFNSVVSAFFDLPAVMTDMENLIYGKDINKAQDNIAAYADMARIYDEAQINFYQNSVVKSYDDARSFYEKNFKNYKTVNLNSPREDIKKLIDETYETAKKISITIKDADNLISFVKDTLTKQGKNMPPVLANHQTLIKTDAAKINSILSNILSAKTAIKTNLDAMEGAARGIKEKELSLVDLKDGADELMIRAKKIAVQQKKDALSSAKNKLGDHYVRAPFAGTVAKIDVEAGDDVSVGAALATIVTNKKIAEILLNEVDAAKIKSGAKATLAFDAIPDLSITGEVAEIDAIGMASQGVVSYGVKIIFDTDDARIKPAMSVSAAIITSVKTEVLLAPASAVKQSGGNYYAELSDEAKTDGTAITLKNPLRRAAIEIGDSNDDFTEIKNGLTEGDLIISRTVESKTAAPTQQQSSSIFRMQGQGGARTGNFR